MGAVILNRMYEDEHGARAALYNPQPDTRPKAQWAERMMRAHAKKKRCQEKKIYTKKVSSKKVSSKKVSSKKVSSKKVSSLAFCCTQKVSSLAFC